MRDTTRPRAPCFARMPEDWVAREEGWLELTADGELYLALNDAVTTAKAGEQADAEWSQETSDHLAGWETWLTGPHCYVVGGADGFARAMGMVEAARLAEEYAREPETDSDEVAGFTAWQRDVLCRLRGTPRKPCHDEPFSLSVLLDCGGVSGRVALLEIDLFTEDATGEIYADPGKFIHYDAAFLQAAEQAWNVALTGCADVDRAALDARFRLVSAPIAGGIDSPPLMVEGSSARAAFEVCLRAALAAVFSPSDAASPLDPAVAVVADVDDGRLLGVDGWLRKMEAAHRRCLSAVIASGDDRARATQALQAAKATRAPARDGLDVETVFCVTCDEVLDTLRRRSRARREVRRYEGELAELMPVLGRPEPVRIADHYQHLPPLGRVEPARDTGSPQLAEDRDTSARITDECPTLAQVLTGPVGSGERAPQILLLGGPGIGKTTVLQYLAWCATATSDEGRELRDSDAELRRRLSGLVPARVRLREWEAWSVSHPEEDLAAYLAAHCRRQNLAPAPTASQWRNWLARGEVLLLLDGFDELSGGASEFSGDHGPLATALRAHRLCPAVVTCRTGSQPQAGLLAELPAFLLAGYEEQQRDGYVRDYPAASDHWDPEALIAHLSDLPRTEALWSNPFLLSVICFVADGSGASLPLKSGQLYDQALTEILRRADARDATVWPSARPNADDRRLAAERVALELQLAGERGVFDGDALRGALSAALGADPGTADLSVTAYREDLCRSSGLLRGDGQTYDWLHPTIQEYLAACALARMLDDDRGAGWKAEVRVGAKSVTIEGLIDRKCWDPDWQELIVFLAGRLRDPVPLIESLADESRDDLLDHRLTLAAICLPETNDEARAQLGETIDRMTSRLFPRWWLDLTASPSRDDPRITRAMSALVVVGGQVDSGPVLGRLLEALRNGSDADSSAALRALDTLGNGSDDFVCALDEFVGRCSDLAREFDTPYRRHLASPAVRALAKLTGRSKPAVDALLKCVREGCREARAEAAMALCEAGLPLPDAVSELVYVVEQPVADRGGMCISAAEVLARLPDRRAYAVAALVDLVYSGLHADAWPPVGEIDLSHAVSALGDTGDTSNAAIDALLAALVGSANRRTRWRARTELQRLGTGARRAVAGLAENLQQGLVHNLQQRGSDTGPSRGMIAQTLARVGADCEEAVQALCEALEHDGPDTRAAAAMALGELGVSEDEAMRTLLHDLSDPAAAAGALRGVSAFRDSPWLERMPTALLEAVIPHVSPTSDPMLGGMACRVLGHLGRPSDEAAVVLAESLGHPGAFVHETAMGALRYLAAVPKSAVAPLVQALTHENSYVRTFVPSVLSRLDSPSESAIDALIAASRDPEANRWGAVRALGEIGGSDERVVPALEELLSNDSDDDVREAAVEALAALGRGSAQVAEILGRWLSNEAPETVAGMLPRLADLELRVFKSGSCCYHAEWTTHLSGI